METQRETFVLVPNARGSALLVSRGKLPCVSCRRGAARVLEALRSTYSLDPPYLRPARIFAHEGNGQAATALYEFDAAEAVWEPRPPLEWLALTDAVPDTLAPPELAPYVEKWLAIARGARVPEARPPWARPGWLAEAAAWLEASIVEAGLEPNGPVELVEQWPLSSVLRRRTGDGYVYLKAVFSGFLHEPALTRALANEHPTLLPEVLAVDVPRGWLLMRELGGTQIGDLGVREWADPLRAVAGLHRHWSDRTSELLALGAQDRTLATLEAQIRAVLEEAGVDPTESAVSELERRCHQLADGPLPQTLVHGDFHPWNVMVDGDELRIFDWSDACVGHPLFDLPTFLQRASDEGSRESLLGAYLDMWTDLAPAGELRAAY